MVLGGWALADEGQAEEGLARIRQGIAAYRATGAEIELSHWLGLLAEACGKSGQTRQGLSALAEALTEVERNGIRYYEPELYRLKGQLTLQSETDHPHSAIPSQRSEAEECFRKAIAIARSQNAKSLQLRATTSLARLLQNQGRADEARLMLAEVYNWFTEGFDTEDLKDAKTLLEELA